MKTKLQIVLTASSAFILTFSGLAQDNPATPASDRSDYARDGIAHSRRPSRPNDAAKASDIIGMTVKNYQDEKLGKVEDLAVDLQSGRIVQVVLSSGGFIGVGERMTAVPPGALRRDLGNQFLLLNADKEKIKNAPSFEMSRWADDSDSNHLSAVYSYYGEESAFGFIQAGDSGWHGQTNALNNSTNEVAGHKADWSKNLLTNDDQYLIPAARLSEVRRASKLMGTPVKNLQDEKLGKVENLLVDLPSGWIVAVVVASGGFLGIDNELSVIPPTALQFTPDRDALQLDTTKEMLSSAPHFNANQWPDVNESGYADGVYRAYKVQPYFSTNANAGPDDTARNVRDRDDRTLTPIDQGNSQADIDTTAHIRKEVLAQKDMSVNAKNVKIITLNDRVTLRGVVNSEEEKQSIGEIANRIAPAGNVNNQLEVKPAPGNSNN